MLLAKGLSAIKVMVDVRYGVWVGRRSVVDDEGIESDPMLVALATRIDSLGQSLVGSVSLNITLLVGGQVVTGRLTSAGSWWDACVRSDHLRAGRPAGRGLREL